MENFKEGMVLHGNTDSNKSEEHYKIIFKCDKKYIHFISVTTTIKLDNLFKITPTDFYGNNQVDGYFNVNNIGKKSPKDIQALIDNKTLRIRPYTAKEVLIGKILTELNHKTQQEREIEQLKQKNKQLEQDLEEANKKVKKLESGQANTEIKDMVGKYGKSTLSADDMNQANKKASNLNEQMGNFKAILSLVGDVLGGKYKIDSGVLFALIGTIVYVISPVDFIPDIIPGLGWLDDIVAVSIAMNSFGDIIEKYKSWKG